MRTEFMLAAPDRDAHSLRLTTEPCVNSAACCSTTPLLKSMKPGFKLATHERDAHPLPVRNRLKRCFACSGTPSVSNSVADVHACYQHLLQQKGKRPEDIVAYGQSVGSGPSCDLAAHEPQLKGLVLHSPLMSGMEMQLVLLSNQSLRATVLD